MIGPTLRLRRKQAGLSLAQVVARCGLAGWDISVGTLAKVEGQSRSVEDMELWVLSRALKLELKDLFPAKTGYIELAALVNKPNRCLKKKAKSTHRKIQN